MLLFVLPIIIGAGKGKDLRDFNRPMTRLRIEANKIKEILSANNEYPVKTEQLHADVDLITKVRFVVTEKIFQFRGVFVCSRHVRLCYIGVSFTLLDAVFV